MAAPQQIGSQSASGLNLFYVPEEAQDNSFALFLTEFLKARSPLAWDLYQRRMAQGSAESEIEKAKIYAKLAEIEQLDRESAAKTDRTLLGVQATDRKALAGLLSAQLAAEASVAASQNQLKAQQYASDLSFRADLLKLNELAPGTREQVAKTEGNLRALWADAQGKLASTSDPTEKEIILADFAKKSRGDIASLKLALESSGTPGTQVNLAGQRLNSLFQSLPIADQGIKGAVVDTAMQGYPPLQDIVGSVPPPPGASGIGTASKLENFLRIGGGIGVDTRQSVPIQTGASSSSSGQVPSQQSPEEDDNLLESLAFEGDFSNPQNNVEVLLNALKQSQGGLPAGGNSQTSAPNSLPQTKSAIENLFESSSQKGRPPEGYLGEPWIVPPREKAKIYLALALSGRLGKETQERYRALAGGRGSTLNPIETPTSKTSTSETKVESSPAPSPPSPPSPPLGAATATAKDPDKPNLTGFSFVSPPREAKKVLSPAPPPPPAPAPKREMGEPLVIKSGKQASLADITPAPPLVFPDETIIARETSYKPQKVKMTPLAPPPPSSLPAPPVPPPVPAPVAPLAAPLPAPSAPPAPVLDLGEELIEVPLPKKRAVSSQPISQFSFPKAAPPPLQAIASHYNQSLTPAQKEALKTPEEREIDEFIEFSPYTPSDSEVDSRIQFVPSSRILTDRHFSAQDEQKIDAARNWFMQYNKNAELKGTKTIPIPSDSELLKFYQKATPILAEMNS